MAIDAALTRTQRARTVRRADLLEEQEGGGGHESSERWLVSYADFITLLFALFVLLYALSNSNHVDQTRAMDSVKRAVGIHPERGGMRPDLGDSGHSTIDEIEHLEAVQEQVTDGAAELSEFRRHDEDRRPRTGDFALRGEVFRQR